MSDNKKVSVIMPTYNCAPFLDESISSVLGQTHHNLELFVVDDCSGDNTQEVVSKYQSDPRFNYIRFENNSGASRARNAGREKATGDYIAYLDSDDVWLPHKLEHQLAFMEKTGAAFSATAYQKVDEEGNPLGIKITPYKKASYRKALFSGNPIGNSTAMYDAKYKDIEIPIIRARNDFALWLAILKKEKYAYGLDEITVNYRVRAGSVSSNKVKLIKSHWELYRKIEHLNIFTSAAAELCWIFLKGFKLREKKIKNQGSEK